MVLPAEDVAHFVAAVLAEEAILKLGFGLPADLWAVAARLGSGSTKFVSRTQPVIDLKPLHAAMLSARRVAKACSAETDATIEILVLG